LDTRRGKRYRVTWKIDIYAGSPKEAAQEARNIQLNEESTATVFNVVDDDGEKTEIDLWDDYERKIPKRVKKVITS